MRARGPAFLLASLTLLAACGPKAAITPAASPAPKATPPAFGFRLPADARPIAHHITLTVDPAKDVIQGMGAIDLERRTAGGVLYLSAHELTITSATLVTNGARLALDATPVANQMVAFTPSVPGGSLTSGRSTLELEWTAKIRRNESQGAFAQEIAGERFVYTQLQATSARRVIPCFDEPGFKAPWQLVLRVPKGQVALSNAPVESETVLPSGLTEVRFTHTPPLPSYLIAFTVGPWEMVDAGKTAGGAPIRVAVPRGRAAEATIPVADTLPILELLEEYFGTPYPFEKLDLVPVPDTIGFSAMENAGLVTFRYSRLLTKPADRTVWTRRRYAGVCAHELAHQWFGNLVTPAWWDDAWLNESFASWMAERIVDTWQPEWELDIQNIASNNRVMSADSRESSRPVRKEVIDDNGIEDAFDGGIVYGKGSAVLDMIEKHIGRDAFRKGVQLHLAKHAWGNASYADLLANLREASGADVREIADDFLDRPGVPFVAFTLACEKGRPPRLDMTQRRFVPFGSSMRADRTWHVPVAVRWGSGKKTGRASGIFANESGSLELTGATACPDWVHPNEAGLGYYRWTLAGAPFEALRSPAVFAALPPEERLDVAQSIFALVSSGDLPYRKSVEVAVTLLDDPERHIRQVGMGAGGGFAEWLPEKTKPKYRAWVAKTYAPIAKDLGLAPKPGEPDDDKMIRSQVVSRMVGDAEDPATIRDVNARARKWLDDRSTLSPELVDLVLALAARNGDAALHERYLAEVRKADAAKDKSERERFLGALAAFRDPALVDKNRRMTLDGELSIHETAPFLWDRTGTPAGAARAWEFLTAHYDEIAKRLPSESRADLVSIGAECSAESLARTKAFFAERLAKELRGPQVFARHVESQEQCIARRAKDTASFVEFLETRSR